MLGFLNRHSEGLVVHFFVLNQLKIEKNDLLLEKVSFFYYDNAH